MIKKIMSIFIVTSLLMTQVAYATNFDNNETSTDTADQIAVIINEEKDDVGEGTENNTQLKEEDTGDEAGQPPVTVVLKPGEKTENSAIVEGSEKVEGDVPTDENDHIYDYTESYESERTVTAETKDVEVTEEWGEVDLEGLDIVKKNDAEGIFWYDEKPKNTGAKFNLVYVQNEETGKTEIRWVPRFVRTNEEMPDWLKSCYTYDENTELWTPKEKDIIHGNKTKPIIDTDDDFNFVFTQAGEESDYNILLADGWKVMTDDNGNPVKVKVLTDADGNVIRDENGNPTYVLNGNNLILDPNGETVDVYAANIRVCDIYGNVYFTYCMDIDTGTIVGDTYVLENLDDITYFEGTEEEQEVAKDHIRAIALNGYWGTTSGTGSLTQIKSNLIQFINTVDDFSFTYHDPEVILGNPDAAKTESKTYSTATAEGRAELLALVEKLNEGAALAVTNSAIWEYGRGLQDPVMAFDKNSWVTDPEFNHAMLMFREYLLSDQLSAQVNGENSTSPQETIIIDKNTFLAEDGLQLTVGDKVPELAQNSDDNQDNDVYNADLSFTMVVTPDKDNDDLVITLVNNDGVVVRKARLAGDGRNDDNTIFTSVIQDGNTYTFTDLQLEENSEFKFDLILEGYQNLEQGVYVYKSSNGNYEDAQTLVGIAEGDRGVDVAHSFTVTFDVDEDNYIHAKRNWRDDGTFDDDDDDDTDTDPEPEPEQKPEPEQEPEIEIIVPEPLPEPEPIIPEQDNENESIIQEDEVLSNDILPQTGFDMTLELLLILFGFGLIGYGLIKKNEE